MGTSRARLGLTSTFFAIALIVRAASASAQQTSPVALDVVAMVDGDVGSNVVRNSVAWFDAFASVRIKQGLDVRVRPVVTRRAFDGAWQTQMYELALRYERPGNIGVRFDVGQITSPMGLAILENRPDLNPVISQHSTLYLPVFRFESGTPTQFLMAASYPLGTQLTFSGKKWDARIAATDSSPVRNRPFFGKNKQPRVLNGIAGAAVTPRIGLRLGGAIAYGPYATKIEVRNQSKGNREAFLTQVEGDWQFRYTRIAGEWFWTWRETAIPDPARVHGGWTEWVQTLSPRFFTAVRYDDQRTMWTNQPVPVERQEDYRRVEGAVGFRVTADLTLRASYLTRKGYVTTTAGRLLDFWDDQFLGSIVYARRIK